MDEDFLRDFFKMPRKHEPKVGRYEGPVMGCVCPVGAEKTCRGPLCPRQPIGPAT
jgi:hypothetical protein